MTRSEFEPVLALSQPFRIVTADGRKFIVRHRDHVAFPQGGRGVAFWPLDNRLRVLPMEPLAAVAVVEATV